MRATETKMSWEAVRSSFRVISASSLLEMTEMKRQQDLRDSAGWLTGDEPPLVLLLISHRWETATVPDPSGRQFRAVQELLRRIAIAVEAALVPRAERLRLVPSMVREGSLQAQEVARRLLRSEAFDGHARERITSAFQSRGDDRHAFRQWLLARIGIWIDYPCLPQEPRSASDEEEFRGALLAVDALVSTSLVVALRYAGDEYPRRGWCAGEYFLASGRSFSRALFVDIERLKAGQEVAMPRAPEASERLKTETYAQDLAEFQKGCSRWEAADVWDRIPGRPWATYCSLQGSAFHSVDDDPNPVRRSMTFVQCVERGLIQHWFMSERPRTFDLSMSLRELALRLELASADPSDLVYLGLVLASNGWIDALRPFLRANLAKYVAARPPSGGSQGARATPPLFVRLTPLPQEARTLLASASPSSPHVWQFRFSVRSGLAAREQELLERLRACLEREPPRFTLMTDGTTDSAETVVLPCEP